MRARQHLAATGVATAALLLAAPIVAAPAPQARAERAAPPSAARDHVLARWQMRTRWAVMSASNAGVRHGQTPFSGAADAAHGHHCGRGRPASAAVGPELAVGGERARMLA